MYLYMYLPLAGRESLVHPPLHFRRDSSVPRPELRTPLPHNSLLALVPVAKYAWIRAQIIRNLVRARIRLEGENIADRNVGSIGIGTNGQTKRSEFRELDL